MRLLGAVCPLRPSTAAGTTLRPTRDAALARRKRRRLQPPPERVLERGRGFIQARPSLGRTLGAANPAVTARPPRAGRGWQALLCATLHGCAGISEPGSAGSGPGPRDALWLLQGLVTPPLLGAQRGCRRPPQAPSGGWSGTSHSHRCPSSETRRQGAPTVRGAHHGIPADGCGRFWAIVVATAFSRSGGRILQCGARRCAGPKRGTRLLFGASNRVFAEGATFAPTRGRLLPMC